MATAKKTQTMPKETPKETKKTEWTLFKDREPEIGQRVLIQCDETDAGSMMVRYTPAHARFHAWKSLSK